MCLSQKQSCIYTTVFEIHCIVYISVLLVARCCSVPLGTIQRLQHMENLVIHIYDQTFRKCKDAEIWISTLWWCLWIVHPLFLFDFEFDFPLRVSNQGRSVLTSSLYCCWFFFVTGNFWKQGMCHMQFIRSTAGLFDLFESKMSFFKHNFYRNNEKLPIKITFWNMILTWSCKLKHVSFTKNPSMAIFVDWNPHNRRLCCVLLLNNPQNIIF